MDDAARAAVHELAGLQRPPGSPGEHAAAERLVSLLAARGARARIERERVHGTYWVPIGLLSAAAFGAAALPRGLGAPLAALAAAGVADELEIARRPLRGLLAQRECCNVVAEIGPSAGARTLVVHAHHDAARTGLVFHPGIAKVASRAFGGLMDRFGSQPPPLAGAVLGPALVALGALARRPRVRLAGGTLAAGHLAAMTDIAHRAAVPAANDNLSGVAALLQLAARLAGAPPQRLRVILLSTGSEESFLEAMVRFGQRWFGSLPRATTSFLCLESVGSPELMLLDGEGLLRLQRYPQPMIRTLTRLARDRGLTLREPFRYRLATDGQVPLRAGYRTAVISSMDWYHAPSNYHWPSDRPENLCWSTVDEATELTEAYARALDREEM